MRKYTRMINTRLSSSNVLLFLARASFDSYLAHRSEEQEEKVEPKNTSTGEAY